MRQTVIILGIAIGLQTLGFAQSDPETRSALRRIYAPQVVGVPPENACRGLMVMPDGEIRHYGFRYDAGKKEDAYRPLYISSRDDGLSWREVPIETPTAGAMVCSPWSGDFLTVLCQTVRPNHETAAASVLHSLKGAGLFAVRSTQGPQGPFTSARVSVRTGFLARLPLPLRERRRWVQPVQCRIGGPTQPGVLLSDDDGVSWREVLLPSPPPHRVEWPHEGVRWQNDGCEPTVVELSDGRLWMLIRTSQDCHYESFSADGGESWTAPPRPASTPPLPCRSCFACATDVCWWFGTTRHLCPS